MAPIKSYLLAVLAGLLIGGFSVFFLHPYWCPCNATSHSDTTARQTTVQIPNLHIDSLKGYALDAYHKYQLDSLRKAYGLLLVTSVNENINDGVAESDTVMRHDTVFITKRCPDRSFAFHDSAKWYRIDSANINSKWKYFVDSGTVRISGYSDCLNKYLLGTDYVFSAFHPVVLDIEKTVMVKPFLSLSLFGGYGPLSKEIHAGASGDIRIKDIAAEVSADYSNITKEHLWLNARYYLFEK